jgi:GMP synthase (glutamine-hydrolysing)
MTTLRKTILFLDPYQNKPEFNCYNDLSYKLNQFQFQYFQPSHFDIQDLILPKSPDLIIVIGSSTHVTDSHPWHTPLAKYLDDQLVQSTPVLGICFGHQLMAHYYGGVVDYINLAHEKETGSRKISFGNQQYQVGVTHRQVVKKLPDQMQELGLSEEFSNEIIAHQTLPFLGIQAHPEASASFLSEDCQIPDTELAQCQEQSFKLISLMIKKLLDNS